MKKISYIEYLKFLIKYFEQPQIKRFGQMFLEEFFPENVNSPLFHLNDFYKSSELIIETYVEHKSVEEFWQHNSEVAQR